MNISLGRFGVFLTGTILIFMIFLARPILLYFFNNVVNGKVIDVESYRVSGGKYSPGTRSEFRDIVQYSVGSDVYTFKDDPSGAPSVIGTEVGVIYNTIFPSEAYTVTIGSIMKHKSLYAVIFFVPWLAFSTSFVGKNEVLILRSGKLRLEKRSKTKIN